MSTPVSDAELVSAMAAGDLSAFAEVYERHAAFVRRVLVRYCGGTAAADVPDLLQDVFLAALDAAPRYRDEGKLRAWLCGIAFRLARHKRSRSARHRWLQNKLAVFSPSRGAQPDEAVMNRNTIEHALAKLPEAQRQVLLLHTAENMSGEEIAVALGIALKTVWTRLHRARAALQQTALAGGGRT